MVNTRFVFRGLLVGIPAAIFLTAVGLILLHFSASVGPPPDATPPPPEISLPRSNMPVGPVSLEEWTTYSGTNAAMVGCGFLLQVNDSQVIGATTAHSLQLSDTGNHLKSVKFRLPGSGDDIAAFENLLGAPGNPRTGEDMTVDFALAIPQHEIPPQFVLQPDPRGLPQPGERLSLVKCDVDSQGQPVVMQGTVQTATSQGFWVLMDDPVTAEAWSGSGSPFFSQHTGKVVGMLIAGTLRGKYALFGAHPIGSLVDLTRTRLAANEPETEPALDEDIGAETNSLTVTVQNKPTGEYSLAIEFTNHSDETVYLPVCGPWEVFSVTDPTRPVWFWACEIDYLGHEALPGDQVTGEVAVTLDAGEYAVRTDVFSDCHLEAPKKLSGGETYFGPFEGCSNRQKITSVPFFLR